MQQRKEEFDPKQLAADTTELPLFFQSVRRESATVLDACLPLIEFAGA